MVKTGMFERPCQQKFKTNFTMNTKLRWQMECLKAHASRNSKLTPPWIQKCNDKWNVWKFMSKKIQNKSTNNPDIANGAFLYGHSKSAKWMSGWIPFGTCQKMVLFWTYLLPGFLGNCEAAEYRWPAKLWIPGKPTSAFEAGVHAVSCHLQYVLNAHWGTLRHGHDAVA